MRLYPARRIYLAPAVGLALIAGMSACSSGSSSTSPQGNQGSFQGAASSVRPSAQSAPPTPASTGTSTGSAASGGSSAAVTQIKANWQEFFNSSTPNSRRVQLLENGSQFASAISAFASSPLASAVTSKVDTVSLSSATKAKVTYDLSALGQKVASGASGSSVLQNGTWKVGDDVFCSLLSQAKSAGLTIPVPAACSSAG